MKNYVITIARGFGSGGKTIGEQLAAELKIKCYNKEILEMASEKSGINEELFFLTDEKVKYSGLSPKSGVYQGRLMSPAEKGFLSGKNLFEYQARIILTLAQTESCVIIGRAADYILRNFPNVVSVNIQAPEDVCIEEIMNRFKMERKEARNAVQKTNRTRAEYYSYYTGQTWNDPCNYDLSISSDRIGRGNCAEYIIDFAERKLGRKIRLE